MLSPQELLKPRYKCIADWPFMPRHIKVGELVAEVFIIKAAKYPHLFKKLEWWEERKPEDMPEYLKIHKFPYKGEYLVLKIGKDAIHSFQDNGEYFGIHWIGGGGTICTGLLPATETEYLNQQTIKK